MCIRDSIHPTAVVDEGAEIGEGTKVWHFCHIEGTAKVGAGCSIGQNGYCLLYTSRCV